MALLPVSEALARILAGVEPTEGEEVPLADALDRTLARDLAARRTQPPWDASAMDGYAVRAADVATVPARLRVIGTAPAGHRFPGTVGAAEAVRIFTGAPLPEGADTIVIQEDTEADGDEVVVNTGAPAGRYVRARGLDFAEGDVLLKPGRRLGPSDLALAAAMNFPHLPVRRSPRVAILATGDELIAPGGQPGPDQIIASNAFGVGGLARRAGGLAIDLGIAPDDREAISRMVRRAVSQEQADVLVTLGGASVGEHDLVRDALAAEGLALDFWRIAMRPGKPLMFGRLGRTRVLGLPGNPVSSLVCSRIFLVPLLGALLGRPSDAGEEPAILAADLPENDRRQDYLRATLARDDSGALTAAPFPRQDSSMLATLARADGLIVRPPFAPRAGAGERCTILRLDI